jgi:integrase
MVSKTTGRGWRKLNKCHGRQKMNALLAKFLMQNNVSKTYESHMQCCVKQMEQFGITKTNISNDRVTKFLASLQGQYSKQTIITKRAIALRLWRWGMKNDVVIKSVLIQVVTIRSCRKPIRAYRSEDLIACWENLQQQSEEKFGRFRKTKASRLLWLKCWFQVAYSTGLRFSDVYHLTEQDITPAGINIVMSKTGQEITRQISEQTRGLIDSMLAVSEDGSIFSCHVGKCRACTTVNELLRQVGLKHGGSQWLRRSSATHVEQNHPGKGSRFLGHLTPGLAARHYFDHSQLQQDVPMPPSIGR